MAHWVKADITKPPHEKLIMRRMILGEMQSVFIGKITEGRSRQIYDPATNTYFPLEEIEWLDESLKSLHDH